MQWSFGVTCWEVFSAGRIPYSGVDAMSMLKILESGTRLEKPDNAACAPEMYKLCYSTLCQIKATIVKFLLDILL